VVTRQLQVEHRAAKVRRSKTDVLPTVPRNQLNTVFVSLSYDRTRLSPPPVCLSVNPSHDGTESKLINVGSCGFTETPRFQANFLTQSHREHPLWGFQVIVASFTYLLTYLPHYQPLPLTPQCKQQTSEATPIGAPLATGLLYCTSCRMELLGTPFL